MVMAWTWKKTALVIGGTVLAGGVAAASGGLLLAPMLGYTIGTAAGLSGAAASSAGLAALGGGALAAGGAGMAGGAAAVATGVGVIGAGAGGAVTAMATSTLKDPKKCKACNAILDESDKHCPQCGKKA
jgi:hypothetical protein